MEEEPTPAFLVVCGRSTGEPMDPEYYRQAAVPALKYGLRPIAGGELGDRVEVLEGALPEGAALLAIEQFPSMQALKAFYDSNAYQAAIPFREKGFEVHFVAAVAGLSPADLNARAAAMANLSES